jgi:hypothetical protein
MAESPMADRFSRLRWVGVLVVIAAAGYGLYALDWGFLDNTITDYSLSCDSGEIRDGRCTGHWYRMAPTTYSLNKDQKTVISQTAGEAPKKLSECAIVNRTNWKCLSTISKSFQVGFAGGEFWSQWVDSIGLPMADTGTVRHVSREKWLRADEDPNKK